MTEGSSSCRPARLLRFEEAVDAAIDGLRTRAGDLDDALRHYRHTCEKAYRAPTVGTEDVVRGFGTGARDWGRWTGDVARAFLDAAAVDAYIGNATTTDAEDVMTRSDSELLDYLGDELDEGEDPFRGIPAGAAAQLAAGLGLDYDQSDPPAWVDYLANGGNAMEVSGLLMEGTARTLAGLPASVPVVMRIEHGSVQLFADGSVVATFTETELLARLRVPSAGAPGLAATGRWLGRAANVLAGVAAAGGQWQADAGMGTGSRVLRAATRGGTSVLGSMAGGAGGGAAGGALAGTVCGPGAPVCSGVLGTGGAILGALAGGVLGDKAADFLPWMDPHEPKPVEHDLGKLTDLIAGDGGHVDPSLSATVDLAASEMALADTASRPAYHATVASLLPDRAMLEHVALTGETAPPVPTGTTTTTTTVPVPAGGIPSRDDLPDPWPGDRPWE
ncbi:MAG TPA: hypothetical protein VH479_04265 [Acidimicrobiales bacterium]